MEQEKEININFVDRGFADMENDLQKMEAEGDIHKIRASYIIPGATQGTFKIFYHKKAKISTQKEDEIQPLTTSVLSNKQLTISSVNCAYTIIGEMFYKVQISEVADPLINEVIFTKILTDEAFRKLFYPQSGIVVQEPQIFPDYINHFSVTGGEIFANNKSIISTVFTNYKVLVTTAIKNPMSVCELLDLLDKFDENDENTEDVLENFGTLMTTIKEQIEILLKNYKAYGEGLGFIHSDLHSNNIQIENGKEINDKTLAINSTLSLKIIDFGRCFVFNEDKIKENAQIKQEFKKFNLPEDQKLDFNNNWQLKNLRNPTEPDDYCCKQYGY